jgi:hypothetical protein
MGQFRESPNIGDAFFHPGKARFYSAEKAGFIVKF